MAPKHLARTFTGSLVVVGATGFLSVLAVTPVLAGNTGTGTLILTGAIGKACAITVTPTAAASNLDLSTTPASTIPGSTTRGLQVATVVENCNDKAGYLVAVATKNGTTTGLFKGVTSGNTDTLAYDFYYGPANGNPIKATFTTGVAIVTNLNKKTGGGGNTNNAYIAYIGASTLTADTYTETLAFTIVGK